MNNGIEIPPKDEEELALEKLVFGDFESFEANLKNVDNLLEFSEDEYEETSDEHSDESDKDDEDMFFIDEGQGGGVGDDPDAMDVDQDHTSDTSDREDDSENAWSDSEDERVNISLTGSDKLKKLRKFDQDDYINGKAYVKRLRTQFEKIYPKPNWVDQQEEQVEEQDEDTTNTNALLSILNQTDKYVSTKQLKLISPNKISIMRLKDGNQTRRSKGAIQTLSFHHKQPLLLTGGFDRTLRIYHIDGKINNLVTSLFLKDSPIYTSYFSNLATHDQNLIFAAGRRKYMNAWDINTGEVKKISRMYGQDKFQKSFEYFKISGKGTFIGLTGSSGYCNILDGLTGQYVKNFKIEGTIIDFEFTNDEKVIIIINTMGEVWEFDMETDKLIKRWQDDSGVGITKIKVGGGKNRWLAIGSNNGIVNLYDRHSTNMTKPFKTVDNLITTISTLEFNPDGQILVVASRGKKDALRLVHLPSGNVYSNWPTSGTPLGKVTSVAFSPDNQLLAIGNELGKVTLWRMNHY